MIKFITIASLILFTNCSLDTRSGIWTKEKKIEEVETKYFKVLKKKLVRKKEFNPNFKINLSKSYSLKSNDLSNNLLIKDFNRNINKSSKFRFSKIKNFDYFEPELVFDGKNFIFFDDKGSLIKFNDNFKIVWKKNFYTKQEKKLKPILTLSSDQKYLVVFDNVAKYYAIDLISGNLIWSKKNKNPFNSQVKIFNKKIYAIDMNNIVRCISLIDGSEIWNFKSENTFLKSPKRNSLIIKNDIVYFNNSLGDIIAISAIDGKLIWQTPIILRY